jgi:hypothetical protein
MFHSHILFLFIQGELEHRVVKRRHDRTSHKNIVPQLVKMDVVETVHDRMYEELEGAYAEEAAAQEAAVGEMGVNGANKAAQPVADEFSVHHKIAVDQSAREYVGELVRENISDPAFKVWLF